MTAIDLLPAFMSYFVSQSNLVEEWFHLRSTRRYCAVN